MRSVPVLAAVIIGAAAVLSGCGQQHPGTSAPPPATAPSVSSSPGPVAAACHGGSPTRGSKLTITAADNGKSFCVTRGTGVAVFLKGTPARKWAPIHASSTVLKPSANGELMLALGVTGASFLAVQPGTAIITSSRPVCGPSTSSGNGAAGTGTLMCDSILAFRATVIVAR